MNYYRRHLGDYAKKAGRLSMLEHGAYNLLIDACYDREQFPTEEQAIGWAWASTPEEIQAVKFVLSRLFTLQDDGHYVQSRIVEELEIYKIGGVTNRLIALAREARKKKHQDSAKAYDDLKAEIKHAPLQKTHAAWTRLVDSLQKQHEPSPNHKPLTTNQEPITNNHKPLTNLKDKNNARAEQKSIKNKKSKSDQKNPAESPSKIFDQDLENIPVNQDFKMTETWKPDPDTWEARAMRSGASVDYSEYLGEFCLYWQGRHDTFNEGQWQGKLINQIKRGYQKTQIINFQQDDEERPSSDSAYENYLNNVEKGKK